MRRTLCRASSIVVTLLLASGTVSVVEAATATQRIEDGDSRIAYAGTWYVHASASANHSGGTAAVG